MKQPYNQTEEKKQLLAEVDKFGENLIWLNGFAREFNEIFDFSNVRKPLEQLNDELDKYVKEVDELDFRIGKDCDALKKLADIFSQITLEDHNRRRFY